MECDPQFKFEMTRDNERVMYYNTSTLEYKDNFDFKDVLEPNINNPFVLNLPSFEVGIVIALVTKFNSEFEKLIPVRQTAQIRNVAKFYNSAFFSQRFP